MVHSSTSGSENIHYHEPLGRVLLNAEHLFLSALESKIPAYTEFNTGIFLGGGNADVCNGHMYQCSRWGFVDFIDIQDIFSMALFQGLCHLEYLTASSVLIYRRKSREIFPCAVLINVRMTRADRCLLKQ